MYTFLLDKSAQDSKSLQDYLIEWKNKNNVRSEDFILDNVDNITSIMTKKGENYSTIIAVGDTKTFEMIVSMAKYYKTNAVLGYVPTNTSTLSKRLGLKDYKQGLQVISQRKIIELTALSLNNRFFLFDFEIIFKVDNHKKANVKILIDDNVQIDLTGSTLQLHNRNQEVTPHSTSILIEAFSNETPSTPKSPLIKLGNASRLPNKKSQTNVLQLRMPANYAEINTDVELLDSYGVALKAPLRIGQHKKTIRLIAKRGQEIQSIMSPGLIS